MKRLWCRLFHRRAMWPGKNDYECATCFQRWPNQMKGDSLWYNRKMNARYGRFAQIQNSTLQFALANDARKSGQAGLGAAPIKISSYLLGSDCAINTDAVCGSDCIGCYLFGCERRVKA